MSLSGFKLYLQAGDSRLQVGDSCLQLRDVELQPGDILRDKGWASFPPGREGGLYGFKRLLQ